MRASELIQKLLELTQEEGDLEVVLFDYIDGYFSICEENVVLLSSKIAIQ